MIEVFKILKGYDFVDAGEEFLQLETGPLMNRTRGHSLKLRKPRHRTYKRNAFFASRVVDPWNSLPDHVINSKSTNEFKNAYDKHQLSTDYSEKGQHPMSMLLPLFLISLYRKTLYGHGKRVKQATYTWRLEQNVQRLARLKNNAMPMLMHIIRWITPRIRPALVSD